MVTLHCIALEGEGLTGVNWYRCKEDRDAQLGKTGAQEEVAFDIEVPFAASDERKTELADAAAWNKSYLDTK